MISITKKLRSAAIVAIAIGALAATGALAQNLSTPGATHRPESKSSHAAKAAHSPEATESPKVAESASAAATDPADASKTAKTGAGKHGECVSAVARNHSLVADNGHGRSTHGAAVSKAAHECPK
jgi:hypothetical protein